MSLPTLPRGVTPRDPLAVDVGGLRLDSPVLGASGCVGFGRELARLGVAGDLAVVGERLDAGHGEVA